MLLWLRQAGAVSPPAHQQERRKTSWRHLPGRDWLGTGLVSPNTETFVKQASEWCEIFAMAVHTGIDPDDESPGFRRVDLGWLSQVGPFLKVGQLGKRVRAAGLSADEALGLMSSGEWDPFADVVMPAPNPDPPQSLANA